MGFALVPETPVLVLVLLLLRVAGRAPATVVFLAGMIDEVRNRKPNNRNELTKYPLAKQAPATAPAVKY
jgi:hypothetical protein